MLVCSLVQHGQVNATAVCAADVFRTRPCVCTTVYKLTHIGHVVLGDYFGDCHVHCDFNGDAELV